MKRIVTICLMALFSFLCVNLNAQEDGIVRILCIGNSFSQDAVEYHLHKIAASDGQKIIIGNMYIPGCSLEKHLNNANENKAAYKYRKIGLDGKRVETLDVTLESALADESWDYVSFQQTSGISGQYKTWEVSLPALLEYVKARVPESTEMILHMTWAYDVTSSHKAFKNYDNDQKLMYRSIVEAVRKIAKHTGIEMIIPCGTAVQNARTTILEDCITRDGYHMHKINGRYTVACVWYEKLFNRSVIGNAYRPEGMSPEQHQAAQKSAHAAVKKPYKVTKIK